jgi:hypothetical protein
MFNHLKTLQGYKLEAIDGPIGKVDEFYFDEQFWTIRYLVVNTGNWLSDRQLLISPHAIGEVSPSDHQISIKLTKKQIAESPFLAPGEMVSKEFERRYYEYYGWPVYWNGSFMWGAEPYLNKTPPVWSQQLNHEQWEPHLCSTHEISRFTIRSMDGEIGSIRDFLISDTTWTIRYLVIDSQKRLHGNYVLISPQWIVSSEWNQSRFIVDISKDQIALSPEYFDDLQLTRADEGALYMHYNRRGYWLSEDVALEMHDHSSWRSHGDYDQELRM